MYCLYTRVMSSMGQTKAVGEWSLNIEIEIGSGVHINCVFFNGNFSVECDSKGGWRIVVKNRNLA